jgi:hypothetical protein
MVLLTLPRFLNIAMVFHRILDFNTGVEFLFDPF